MTINDHFSFLDKHEDIKFKVKFEKMNEKLEDIELSLLTSLQTNISEMIINHILERKKKKNDD